MTQIDYLLTNGRFELPPSAKGVILVPIEHRDTGARPVAVRSKSGPELRPFGSFFRRRPHSAR